MIHHFILIFSSFLFIAFGQPASIPFLGTLGSIFGFSLFFYSLLMIENQRFKFLLGFSWFTGVQLIQLSWFISHPYTYIYFVYFFLALLMGVQFGFFSIFINKSRIHSILGIFGLCSLWTLIEWSRLFLLSGFPFNPVGLLMTTHLYPMQLASIFGIYGLSFWTMFVNLLLLHAFLKKSSYSIWVAWMCAAFFPFLFGGLHYHYHYNTQKENDKTIEAILVQTAFPIEENLGIHSTSEFIAYVLNEWKQILSLLKKDVGKQVDIIVLPEFVVPLGTYTFVYPLETVKEIFEFAFGSHALNYLETIKLPFAKPILTENGVQYFVNNAFLAKSIANFFNAPILLGLEDVDENKQGEKNYFSSAIYIQPHPSTSIERYEKRILVPMGEYIPFNWCRKMAENYGIKGSFTCGNEAKVFHTQKFPFGISICYEETYGDIMRESAFKGAEILFNLTSDVWYPTLAKQHFDHARLRTIESGIPLIRSCNTGITCAIDSVGNVIKELPEYDHQGNWLADTLHVVVPAYHYATLYSKFGDSLIIGFSFLCLPLVFMKKRKFEL